jgi:hypothetical protein
MFLIAHLTGYNPSKQSHRLEENLRTKIAFVWELGKELLPGSGVKKMES